MHEKVLAERLSEQGARLFGNLNGKRRVEQPSQETRAATAGLEMNDKKHVGFRGVLALFEAVHQLFLENARKE